jgi:hypothetical protein
MSSDSDDTNLKGFFPEDFTPVFEGFLPGSHRKKWYGDQDQPHYRHVDRRADRTENAHKEGYFSQQADIYKYNFFNT